jgi:hypothetical protein
MYVDGERHQQKDENEEHVSLLLFMIHSQYVFDVLFFPCLALFHRINISIFNKNNTFAKPTFERDLYSPSEAAGYNEWKDVEVWYFLSGCLSREIRSWGNKIE